MRFLQVVGWVCCAVCLCCALATGVTAGVATGLEPPALVITEAGYFLLTVDEAGRPIVQEVTRVITIGTPTTPPTQPPTQPPTVPQPPTQSLSAKAREWAAKVPPSAEKPLVQRGLATCLRTVGESTGRIKSVQEAETLLRELIRATIPESQKAAWLPFGQSLTAELDARKPGLTVAQYGALLLELAKGLE